MFFHEFGDDFVLLDELGLKEVDLAILGLLGAKRTPRPMLECLLGLLEVGRST